MTNLRKARPGSGEQMRTLSVRGRVLRVAVRDGNPDWPPLLLCNGIGARLELLQPFVDALDRRRAVIRFDMPGVGASPAPALPYHLATLPPLLSGLLDQLGYQEADVLGISWGGGLAQQFALSRPDRVRRLVLVATGSGALMVPGHPRVLLRMLTPRRHRDPAYAARIAGDLYGGSVRDDPALARDLLRATARPGPARGYYYQLASGIGWTSLPRLPRLQQPTLILAGDDDPIIPLVNARIMHRRIPRSELHIYHGGHLDLATRAGRLAPVVEAFLTAETANGTAAPHDKTRRRRRRWGRTGRLRAHTAGRPADHLRSATALRGHVSQLHRAAQAIALIALATLGLPGAPIHAESPASGHPAPVRSPHQGRNISARGRAWPSRPAVMGATVLKTPAIRALTCRDVADYRTSPAIGQTVIR